MADRLINADKLVELLDEELENRLKWETNISDALQAGLLVGFAKQVINDAPAVDAEPVVRCKDCKHRMLNPHGYTCKRVFKEVTLDDFCAWGERREDGKEGG